MVARRRSPDSGTMDGVDEASVPEAELFLDDRGSLLRARWDTASGQVQLSIWRDGRCVATHSLDAVDAARLSSLLTHALVDSIGRLDRQRGLNIVSRP